MEKKFRIWNLIGGIILLLYAVFYIVHFVISTNALEYASFFDFRALSYLLPKLVVVIAGSLLVVDFVKNYANNKKSKQPAIATVIAFALIIPLLVNVLLYYYPVFIKGPFKYQTFLMEIPFLVAIIVVIGLCAINKKSIIEFLKNRQESASKKPSATIKFFQCVGGGLLSVFALYSIMRDDFARDIYSREWGNVLTWLILVVAAACCITIKIVGSKPGNIVKLCALYLLVLFEFMLIVGSRGDFFMEDGIGWMVLKVACAAFVLFCQLLLIQSCFKYFNKKNGAFTASLFVGSVAVATSVIAIVVAVYAIIIAVVLIVGYVILMLVGHAGGRRGKRGISVTHADGTVEEFEESGINLMGETTYRNKYGGEAYSRDEIKRGDASRN